MSLEPSCLWLCIKVNVCSGKVTLICVCVCACASTGKGSILIIVLHIPVIIKVLVDAQFKTCWQFDVIWWESTAVSTSTGV
jgi:hypothetical protein